MCPSRGILLSLVLIAVCHFPSRVVLAQSSPIPVIKIDGQEATPTDTVTVTAFESVWLVSESYDDDEGGCCIVQTDWYLNGAGYRFYRGDSTLFAFHDSLSIQSIKLIIKDDEVQYGSLTVPVKVVAATTEQLTGRQYYLKDHLGSIRATVNDTGAVVHTSDYYPFGLEMPGRSTVVGSGDPKERFTGHELDGETGLLYAGARFYDPEVAAWSAVDPLSDKYLSLGPYVYSSSNPVRYIDRDGREWEDPKEAEKIKNQLKSKLDAMDQTIRKLQNRIAKGGRRSKGSQKELKELQSKRGEVASVITEMDAMGRDKNNVFRFERTSSNIGSSYLAADGVFVMRHNGSLELKAHEITHGYQHLTGVAQHRIGSDGREVINYRPGVVPMDTEVAAYRRQFAVNTGSMPPSDIRATKMGDITRSMVLSIYQLDPVGKKEHIYDHWPLNDF